MQKKKKKKEAEGRSGPRPVMAWMVLGEGPTIIMSPSLRKAIKCQRDDREPLVSVTVMRPVSAGLRLLPVPPLHPYEQGWSCIPLPILPPALVLGY